MEKWIIVDTTDGKNKGRTFEVPFVSKQIAYEMSGRRFWFDKIIYDRNGERLTLVHSNYKVTLNRLK